MSSPPSSQAITPGFTMEQMLSLDGIGYHSLVVTV